MQQTLKTIAGLCALGAILLLIACGRSSKGGGSSPTPAPTPPERITFSGVGTRGIFDPSIARDPSDVTGRLWMSYSAVDPSQTWSALNVDAVATRLAYSDNNGRTWTDSGTIVSNFLDVTLPLASPNDAGTWVNEVSQLIYDPGATANERWKILWHHYLTLNRLPVNDRRRFEHGWIAMKMAGSPEGLAAAPEIKLFAGYGYDAGNNTAGGGSRSPLGGAPLIQLDTALNSALNTCVFTEPGMYASSAALYLSLQCQHLDPASPDRLIVLLKCASPCNTGSAASWSYLGTLLNKSNAAAFGFDDGFAASGLFASAGNLYVVATPVQTSGAPWSAYYSGCHLFRFTDIDSALLQKTGVHPTLIASVNGTSGSFNGACSYHASASNSGMLYSELNTSVTDRFQIFMSHTNF